MVRRHVFGGSDGLQSYEFTIAVAILAAAFASEAALGIFMLGWTCIILGTWILFHGRYSDPLLLVDTANSILCMYTFGGWTKLDAHKVMLLHATFHVSIVTLAAMLIGPKKWFAGTVPLLYTCASYAMMIADRSLRAIEPGLEDVVLRMSTDAADYLTTPWAWCVYSLMGGEKQMLAFPFVVFVAYKSILAMYFFPATIVPATIDLLGSAGVSDSALAAKAIIAGLPAMNVIVLYPVVWPRIIAAFKHGASIIGLDK